MELRTERARAVRGRGGGARGCRTGSRGGRGLPRSGEQAGTWGGSERGGPDRVVWEEGGYRVDRAAERIRDAARSSAPSAQTRPRGRDWAMPGEVWARLQVEASVEAHEAAGVERLKIELLVVQQSLSFGVGGEENLEAPVEQEAVDLHHSPAELHYGDITLEGGDLR